MTIKRIPWLLLLGGLPVAAAIGAVTVAAQGPANQIHGHWIIQGTPEVPGPSPFVNVAALTSDGLMVNVDPDVGTSVGGWARLRGRQYAVTFTGFVPGPGGLRYVVRATATLSGDGQHLGGPYHTDVLDSAGNTVFSYGGTVSAWRQALEPF